MKRKKSISKKGMDICLWGASNGILTNKNQGKSSVREREKKSKRERFRKKKEKLQNGVCEILNKKKEKKKGCLN